MRRSPVSSPAVESRGRYLHERVAARIREDIFDRNLERGTRLKPIRELTEEYKASYLTVHKAIGILRKEGLLESRGSAGTFVLGADGGGRLERKNGSVGGGSVEAAVKSIAVVHPVWMSEEFPHHFGQAAVQRVLNGFLSVADPFNWRIEMVYSGPPDEAALTPFVDKITKRGVDAVLWIRPNLGHRMNMMRLVDRGVEVLGFGRKFFELPVEVLSEDHQAGARLVFDWFLSKGKKRVGFLAAPMEGRVADPYVRELFEVYERAAADLGIEFDESHVFQGYGLPKREKEVLLLEFFERLRPDALVCLFNPIIDSVAELRRSHASLAKRKMVFADLIADYRPMRSRSLGDMPVASLHYPLEALGKQLAWHFAGKWAPDSEVPGVEALPTLEKP